MITYDHYIDTQLHKSLVLLIKDTPEKMLELKPAELAEISLELKLLKDKVDWVNKCIQSEADENWKYKYEGVWNG